LLFSVMVNPFVESKVTIIPVRGLGGVLLKAG